MPQARRKKDDDKPGGDTNRISLVITELLLIMLPFIVFGSVYSYKGEIHKLQDVPEWSIAASVLMVQTLAKFLSWAFRQGSIHTQRVQLIVVLLIVIGFLPCLITLIFVLMEEPPPPTLAALQLAVFAYAVGVFIYFGVTMRD